MSLKRKIQYVYTISSAVVAFALVLGILLSIKGMSMLTDTLDNNDKALKLYKAVTKERNALKLYFEDEPLPFWFVKNVYVPYQWHRNGGLLWS